jgi:tetratricopeptide (TPR) repeat protein
MKTDQDRLAVSAELSKIEGDLADEALLHLVESYENGAVFAFYFAEKLEGIEESGFDISGSIRDWILTLDPKTEANRLEQNREASQKALLARERRKTEKATTLVDNPLTQELIKIDGVVNSKGFEEAETRLNSLLDEYSENTVETARIYYSLGRMTSLKAENTTDPEEVSVVLEKASSYYKRVLQTASPNDRALISSTYFALGNIYEHFDQDDYALKIYDAALRIGKVDGGAFDQAFDAKKALLEKMKKP